MKMLKFKRFYGSLRLACLETSVDVASIFNNELRLLLTCPYSGIMILRTVGA